MLGNLHSVKESSSSLNERTSNRNKKAYESIEFIGESNYTDEYIIL